MGRLIPFRRRRRWNKPGDYGHHDPKREVTARGLLRDTIFWLRPVMLFAALVILWPTLDGALIEPPSFLAAEPERINAHFTRCGPGRGHACVIDGDTFKLGTRKVRIIGIDAPEVDARCPEEAAMAERATVELQTLLNRGPFEMVGRTFGDKDRYGRDLRSLRWVRADGTSLSIAEEMRQSGVARRYWGGFKGGWC